MGAEFLPFRTSRPSVPSQAENQRKSFLTCSLWLLPSRRASRAAAGGALSAGAQAAPVSAVALWACSADADTILLAGLLTFKEGRNFKTKKKTSKGTQRLSVIWDGFTQQLLECGDTSSGMVQLFTTHSYRGPQISRIKQWAKQLRGAAHWKTMPQRSAAVAPSMWM